MPRPEIIGDLLTDNWQLRLQVLDIFDQARSDWRDHAAASRQKQELEELGERLAATLNGPWDSNLELVLPAAFLLGGNRFIFKVLRRLQIDDRAEFYPELQALRRRLETDQSDSSFYSYFAGLLSAAAVESTTAAVTMLVVRLFAPDQSLALLALIPQPDYRVSGIISLRNLHPEHNFNPNLCCDQGVALGRLPELIYMLDPDQPPFPDAGLEKLIPDLLEEGFARAASVGCESLTNLMYEAAERWPQGADRYLGEQAAAGELAALRVLAARGSEDAGQELRRAAAAWRRRTRLQALPGLAACPTAVAVEVLQKRCIKGDSEEQIIAGRALSRNRHKSAAERLWQLFLTEKPSENRCRYLQFLCRQPGPSLRPELLRSRLDELIANPEFYPWLPLFLDKFLRPSDWFSAYLERRRELTLDCQLQICARLAQDPSPEIQDFLLSFMRECDWQEAFQLLCLINSGPRPLPLPALMQILADKETGEELSIHERLRLGRKTRSFSESLAFFLDQRPALAAQLLCVLARELVAGSFRDASSLQADFSRLPSGLRGLLLGEDGEKATTARLPLLMMTRILPQLKLPGSHALQAVVHLCHQDYSYFEEIVTRQIETRLQDNHPTLRLGLTELHELLEFLRPRPQLAALRKLTLEKIAVLIRRCRDLRLFSDAAHDRDLRVIRIKRLQ
ncbi:MAG: hypothetical protein JXR89_06100 [Deltaproteobacteria bacterium]|nr:hypothetical protein [Deltaproteobacteria bacterium]